MNNLLYYGLQVIATSGILYGYYHFFLRNKKFHQYNRFYLLAATLVSIIVPFLDIPVYFTHEQRNSSALLQALTTDDTVLLAAGTNLTSPGFDPLLLLYYGYILITATALLRILVSLNRIRKLKKTNPGERIDDILFITTTEQDTPFSFFNLLFWNKEIELNSSKGEQVFRHELFHIRQYHSMDVIFTELVTTICWINPFFHIIKKEIKAIHEFLADQYAVTPTREWEYAELLLVQALQTKQSLVNPFFHNQIKRRIAMITLSQQPRHRYFRKIMVLPLLALITALFAFSYKNLPETKIVEQRVAGINPDETLQLQPIPADTPKLKITAGKQVIEVRKSVEKPAELLIEKRITDPEPLIVVNNVIQKEKLTVSLGNMDPNSIESISILKDSKAVEKYGAAGNNGVIEIKTKSGQVLQIEGKPFELTEDRIDDKKDLNEVVVVGYAAQKKEDGKLFTQLEENPAFPGGQTQWQKYLERNLNSLVPVDHGAPAGAYTVKIQFIVDQDGFISDIKPLTNYGYGMEDEVIRILKAGPRWTPGKQNGHLVKAIKQQPVTFVIEDDSRNSDEIVVTGYPSRKFTTIEDESKSGATTNTPAENNNSTDGNIYPNPTSNLVQVPVSSAKSGSALLQVVDAAGNIVLTQRPALGKGSNTVAVNTMSLKPGAYIIKLTTPEGSSRSYKMMKK